MDDLITSFRIEDLARGTLGGMHNSTNSVNNFPCARYRTVKFCPTSNPKTLVEVRNLRSGRKSRSDGPCRDRSKICRILNANDSYRGHIYAPPQGHSTLQHHVANSPCHPSGCRINLEKTLSCPVKLYGPTPHNPLSFTSQSSVQMEQLLQNVLNTDEVVNRLRGEIEKVKHELHHLSQQRFKGDWRTKILTVAKTSPSIPQYGEEAQVTVMRNENMRLKHEIKATRKLLEKSRSEVLKIKDILTDYGEKVNLLHVQALKSSKAVKKTKEAFCLCIKDKDTEIKTLKATNDVLEQTVRDKTYSLNEKDEQMEKLNESINSLKQAFEETTARCSLLNEINQNVLLSIDLLKAELDNSANEVEKQKKIIQSQEQKICDLYCLSKKAVSRTRKRNDSSKSSMKNDLQEQEERRQQISPLSMPLEKTEKQKTAMEQLQCKCPEFGEKVQEYEASSVQCKGPKGNSKDVHEKFLFSENSFNKQKRDMGKLIAELTDIVQEYKVTITQMSEINKQQEIIINNQGVALLAKEEELNLIKKETHSFKDKSRLLEQEVKDLKKNLPEAYSQQESVRIYKELQELRTALNTEKDNQLVKEKIIQDQCETILDLQSQLKEKMQELTHAQDDNRDLEREIGKINEKLIMKDEELGLENNEKRSLIEKLRILECQKHQVSKEIREFEVILQQFIQKYGDNEKQKALLKKLKEEISEQKKEWDSQKQSLGREKDKAVWAAKFATQKLIDAVEDYQQQVNTQKKVQLLLTKMLHEKDDQLRFVQSKVSNITSTKKISQPRELLLNDVPKQELFFHKQFELQNFPSNRNTSTSPCSNSNKKPECEIWRRHGKYFRIDDSACVKSEQKLLGSMCQHQ